MYPVVRSASERAYACRVSTCIFCNRSPTTNAHIFRKSSLDQIFPSSSSSSIGTSGAARAASIGRGERRGRHQGRLRMRALQRRRPRLEEASISRAHARTREAGRRLASIVNKCRHPANNVDLRPFQSAEPPAWTNSRLTRLRDAAIRPGSAATSDSTSRRHHRSGDSTDPPPRRSAAGGGLLAAGRPRVKPTCLAHTREAGGPPPVAMAMMMGPGRGTGARMGVVSKAWIWARSSAGSPLR
jgi:hypothetical protein